MDTEKCAVNSEFFGGYRKINPLEQGVGRCPGTGTLSGTPVAEGKKSDALHTFPQPRGSLPNSRLS